MTTQRVKRLGAFALAALHLYAINAFAATATCNTTNTNDGLGGALSVIGNGTITLGAYDANGQCNVAFYGGDKVNALIETNTGNDHLIYPGQQQSSDAKKCQAQSASGTSSTLSSTGTPISASSITQPPSYQESTSTRYFEIYNSSQLNVNGVSTQFGDLFTCKNIPTGHTCTVNSTVAGKRSATVDGFTVEELATGSYRIPGGDYDYVKTSAGSMITFGSTIRAKTVAAYSCNKTGGYTFAGGDSFINELGIAAGCLLDVAGDSPTTLNVLGKPSVDSSTIDGFTINGGPTCVNVDTATCLAISSAGKASVAQMAAQKAANLRINVYFGDLNTQGDIQIAGGIYVAKGNANFGNGTPLTVVGEILSTGNITTQNNNGTSFYHQATTISGSSGSSSKYSYTDYTLATTAIPALVTAGDLMFVAAQRDGEADGTPGASGHLYAYTILDSGAKGTLQWDAAAKITAVAAADRLDKYYTNNDDTNFVKLSAASAAAKGALTNVEYAVSPPAAALGGRLANSIGRPWRTAPVIVGDSVLFATDDGFLYSVSRADGSLNWAWVPRQILPMTTDQATLMSYHPWGQIHVVSDSVTALTGTAMGGQLHFAIEISADGKSLNKVLWSDYRPGAYSPGSTAVTGWPFGGAAPIEQITPADKTRVAYIVGNKLVTRGLTDAASVAGASLGATASSNVIYYTDDQLFFGDASGKLQAVTKEVDATLDTHVPTLDLHNSGKPVLGVNGASLQGGASGTKILLAQTADTVTAVRYDADATSVNGGWSVPWYTGVGVSSTDSSSSADESTKVPHLPFGQITALPQILNGYVYIPLTKSINVAADTANCVPAYTSQEAYTFGPVSLRTGLKVKDTTIAWTAQKDLTNYVGPGEHTGIVVVTWVKGGKTYPVVESTSMGTKGTWKNGATGSSSGGGSSSSGGANSSSGGAASSSGGSSGGAGGWSGNGIHQELTSNATAARLNWRELTNFF